jgi:hypothetical protein
LLGLEGNKFGDVGFNRWKLRVIWLVYTRALRRCRDGATCITLIGWNTDLPDKCQSAPLRCAGSLEIRWRKRLRALATPDRVCSAGEGPTWVMWGNGKSVFKHGCPIHAVTSPIVQKSFSRSHPHSPTRPASGRRVLGYDFKLLSTLPARTTHHAHSPRSREPALTDSENLHGVTHYRRLGRPRQAG